MIFSKFFFPPIFYLSLDDFFLRHLWVRTLLVTGNVVLRYTYCQIKRKHGDHYTRAIRVTVIYIWRIRKRIRNGSQRTVNGVLGMIAVYLLRSSTDITRCVIESRIESRTPAARGHVINANKIKRVCVCAECRRVKGPGTVRIICKNAYICLLCILYTARWPDFKSHKVFVDDNKNDCECSTRVYVIKTHEKTGDECKSVLVCTRVCERVEMKGRGT